MPRFAANLSLLFTEIPFLDRFGAAARAGFRGVEFLFPYDYAPAHIAARLSQNALAPVLFNLYPGDWENGDRGLAIFPEKRHLFRESVTQAAHYAEALGCKRLHCLSGITPAGADVGELRATYIENLKFASGVFVEQDVTLLIEPINTRDIPGYFLHSTAEAAKIIAEVGAPNLRLQYDVYHMQIMEGRIEDTIARLFDLIAHVQIADVPGRHEPGSGDFDFASLFVALDRLGYGGWVGCEYRPSTTTEQSLAWLRNLPRGSA